MKNRSVIEVMVLTFTFIVGFTLVMTGVTIAIIEIKNPTADTDTIVQSLISLISGILGALLGLIAGKTAAVDDLSKRPSGEKIDVGGTPY
jgi:cytochrome c biogenesis protein CcdA